MCAVPDSTFDDDDDGGGGGAAYNVGHSAAAQARSDMVLDSSGTMSVFIVLLRFHIGRL